MLAVVEYNKKKREVYIMKQFNYVITDEIGIHARPAGMLAKEDGKMPCSRSACGHILLIIGGTKDEVLQTMRKPIGG